MTDGNLLVLRRHDEVAEAANVAFRLFCKAWAHRLAISAQIEHVGATAVPGSLTKGDVSICVRVDAADFATIDEQFAQSLKRNTAAFRSRSFSSFNGELPSIKASVHLVAKGAELDLLVSFRDNLRSDVGLRAAYDALKLRYAGRPMADYRRAKAIFIWSTAHRRSVQP